MDYSSFPPYMQYDVPSDSESMYNPINQYEQAYTYYKYLCMQMDYKIKCKEYEKLCSNNTEISETKKSTSSLH